MDSAIAHRRERMWNDINRTAMKLADERGFDGFTMDELAAVVGVSRRTLFNYFPSKMDAVLGADEPPRSELFDTFLAGGPTGNFAADVKALAIAALDIKQADAGQLTLFRRLLRDDARIAHAAHDRIRKTIEHLVPLIQQRPNQNITEQQARLTIRLVVTICDVALDAYIDDPQTTFPEHFSTLYDATVDLFR